MTILREILNNSKKYDIKRYTSYIINKSLTDNDFDNNDDSNIKVKINNNNSSDKNGIDSNDDNNI